MLIDFHTHCFADEIYKKAMESLIDAAQGYIPSHDGSLSGLQKSMEDMKIDISVVHTIATKPKQTPIINDWAISIQSEKIIPFGTIHPGYEDWENEIDRIKAAGIKGIKFHPDYQGFFSDDKKVYPIYEKVAQEKMLTMFHCGLDVAFPNLIRNTPAHMKNVLTDIPELIVVGAHMGGHRMYDEVAELLTPMNIYIDTSFAHYILGDKKFAWLIKKHGAHKVLFGSDSPWDNAREQADIIERLDLTADEKDLIFYNNAKRLLKI